MGSKREEERNEKIIRGLMKLPPNRRCINCNSLGPQYVCTNFWTFICTTCSGIHREFTHRVKSVSMAKFSFQEVDALQKGGNQRARELFLKAWDPDRNRLVDNSNIDKLRDFIKNVYVDKKFSVEKSSDRPPRDPQCLRNHEDEMRRASSYHSYSQSPPYDFQYEERRYGKHAPSLTRKPGSDRGLYEGKLAGFLSPNRLSDYAKNDRFSKEGSYSRMPDYCGDGGTDLFKSDVLSPSSQHESGSPFSETSRDISTEVPSLHISDAISSKVHPQRTASLGSFGSFDSSSTSFKAVHSTSFPEVGSELGHFAEDSHDKSARVPSLPQSSESRAFDGLDLFSASFAPQNVPSTPPIGSNFQLPESSLAQSVNVTKQSSTSSVHLTVSAILQPSALDLFTSPFQQQSAASNKEMASNAEKPDDGGWATFDTPQNIGTENSAPAALPSSDGSVLGNFNPFSTDQSNSFQASSGHEPSASTFAFETTDYWNTFDPSAEGHPTQNVLEVNEQAALHSVSDAEKLLRDGGFKSSSDHGRVTTSSESPPLSSLSSNFNITLNDFPMGSSVAGMDSFATDHTPSNPFDLPYDSAMESTNMSQFWNMSSLQVALPNLQMPATCDGGINQPWFTQNSVPSFVPGGVSFDSSSGSLGFIAGQAPNTSIATIHAQGPVASVGGNPFA